MIGINEYMPVMNDLKEIKISRRLYGLNEPTLFGTSSCRNPAKMSPQNQRLRWL